MVIIAIGLSERYIPPIAVEENIKPARRSILIQSETDWRSWRVSRRGVENGNVPKQLQDRSQSRINFILLIIVHGGYGSFSYSVKTSFI